LIVAERIDFNSGGCQSRQCFDNELVARSGSRMERCERFGRIQAAGSRFMRSTMQDKEGAVPRSHYNRPGTRSNTFSLPLELQRIWLRKRFRSSLIDQRSIAATARVSTNSTHIAR
jgi:hypothetical protein